LVLDISHTYRHPHRWTDRQTDRSTRKHSNVRHMQCGEKKRHQLKTADIRPPKLKAKQVSKISRCYLSQTPLEEVPGPSALSALNKNVMRRL